MQRLYVYFNLQAVIHIRNAHALNTCKAACDCTPCVHKRSYERRQSFRKITHCVRAFALYGCYNCNCVAVICVCVVTVKAYSDVLGAIMCKVLNSLLTFAVGHACNLCADVRELDKHPRFYHCISSVVTLLYKPVCYCHNLAVHCAFHL